MRRTGLLFILLIFTACGLPTGDELEDLQPPMSLSASVVCSGSTPIAFDLSFYGYNDESFFSGYNVYMVVTTSTESLENIQNIIANKISQHVPSENETSWDQSVEDNNIIKNDTNTLPTLNRNFLNTNYPDFDNAPTLIQTQISKKPDNTQFQLLEWYGFGISAVSTSNRQETVPSNVYRIQYSCP
jgi:hypothetical protein